MAGGSATGAVARRGIYFIDVDVPSEAPRRLRFFEFKSRRVKQLGTVESTVSVDARQIKMGSADLSAT